MTERPDNINDCMIDSSNIMKSAVSEALDLLQWHKQASLMLSFMISIQAKTLDGFHLLK